MEKTMKAVVTYAPGDNRYEDFPFPELEDGEVLLKVKACGICAGDLKAFHGGIRVWGTSEADRYMEPPCIPGHEFYGEVVDIKGEEKKHLSVRDLLEKFNIENDRMLLSE